MQVITGVQHAGDVLGLFSPARPEWGAADVGRALGLSRSHAHRLLTTLASIGLLDRSGETGRFRLSWAWLSYASVLFATDHLVKAGIPVMRGLGAISGVDPMLAVWGSNDVLALRPHMPIGAKRMRLDECTTTTIVLMAGLSDDDVCEMVSTPRLAAALPPRADLDRSLRHVRTGGVLARAEVHDADEIWVAAAPVIDRQGSVVAALTLRASHGRRFNRQRAGESLKRASVMLSNGLSREPRTVDRAPGQHWTDGSASAFAQPVGGAVLQ